MHLAWLKNFGLMRNVKCIGSLRPVAANANGSQAEAAFLLYIQLAESYVETSVSQLTSGTTQQKREY
jgi:hypothetical protein